MTSASAEVQALVSIHDVMPRTLERVRAILERCAAINPGPVTLLVVPGLAWDRDGIEQLRRWQDAGHRLAGHGWVHEIDGYGGIGHRLHGLFISRRAGEHLSLDASGINALIRRCHAWFGDQGLGAPSLYVPPAWALGPLPRPELAALPFASCELLWGVHSTATGRLIPVPMVGYEADNAPRAPAIRLWNRLNRRWAESNGWLRIGIHPQDPELHLAEDLEQDLARYSQWRDYDALLGTDAAQAPRDSQGRSFRITRSAAETSKPRSGSTRVRSKPSASTRP